MLATCNRIELYADVDKFHAGVAELSTLLAQHSGVGLDELTPYLYVHYEDRAVHHLFSVACGLDSMVVGEGQILGQIKDALARRAGPAHRRPAAERPVPAGAAGRQARPHARPGSTGPGSRWSPSAWSSSQPARPSRPGSGQAGPGHRRRFDVLARRDDARAGRCRRTGDRQPDPGPRRAARKRTDLLPRRGRRARSRAERRRRPEGARAADRRRCPRSCLARTSSSPVPAPPGSCSQQRPSAKRSHSGLRVDGARSAPR